MSRRRGYDERNRYDERDRRGFGRTHERSERNDEQTRRRDDQEYSGYGKRDQRDRYDNRDRNYRRRDYGDDYGGRRRDYDDSGYGRDRQEESGRSRRRREEPQQQEPRRQKRKANEDDDPLMAEALQRIQDYQIHPDDPEYESTLQGIYERLSKGKKKRRQKPSANSAPFQKNDPVEVQEEWGESWKGKVLKCQKAHVLVTPDDPDYDVERVPIERVSKVGSSRQPRQVEEPSNQRDNYDANRRSRPAQKPSHNFKLDQAVEAVFDTETMEFLPAKVTGINPLAVIWEGYEEEGSEEREPKYVRAIAMQIEVGDKVNAPYDDGTEASGNYDGIVKRIENENALVAFEGYDDYEPYPVALSACTLVQKASELPQAEEPEVEEQPQDDENDKNWRPEPPSPKFQNRDTVWYFEKDQKPIRPQPGQRGGGEWENATKCYIRSYDEFKNTYDLSTAGRDRQSIRGVHEDQLLMCGDDHSKAKCVFAYVGKKAMHRNAEWIDTWRMFFWKGGNPKRVRTDRDENHNFPEVYPEDDDHCLDEDWMVWRDDIDLPELPWWCPPTWDIPYGSEVKLTEDGEERKGRIKGYCPTMDHYFVEIRNGELKEMFTYKPDILTLLPNRKQKARMVFGFWGKRIMSKRTWEGLWRLVTRENRRPPEIAKIVEMNETKWDEVEEIDEYGIKYVGENFPKFPDGEYFTKLKNNLPQFYEYDLVNIDGDEVVNEVAAWAQEAGEEAFDSSGLRGSGRIKTYHFESGTYCVDVRFYEHGSKEAEIEDVEIWLSAEKITRRIRMEDKAEVIFGAFQQQTIGEKDFKLAADRFFNDRIMNLQKACEGCGVIDFDDEKRTVTWEPEDLPARSELEKFKNAPRVWKNNSKAQFRTEGAGWRACTIQCEESYGSGRYKVNDMDDGAHTVDCIDLRPIINFTDKVRAVFAEEQKDTLEMNQISARVNDLFGDTIPYGVHDVYSTLQEKLEDRGIDCDFELSMCTIKTIPTKNLRSIWALKSTMSFRERIDQVWVLHEDKQEMTCDEFNELFEGYFDDHIADFNRIFEGNHKYEFDAETNIIKLLDRSKLGGGDMMVSWSERFKDKKLDWDAAMAEENFIEQIAQMYRADAEVQNRKREELDSFWEENNIQYQSEKDNEHLEDGFPLPAFTFEEAFRSYAEDKDVGHLAKGILAKLNSDFKRPTAIQSCCWPALFTDRDILGISKTGSGKTLTFGLPTILKVAKQKTRVTKSFGSYCHALIVVPTRELANQHVSALKPFCDLGGISIEALIGGNQNFREQASKVESGQDILVCTVGRLLHFLSEDMLSLMNTSVIVLDEADEMLVGFEEGIREVLMNQIRSTMSRQCLLFSATYADEVMELEHAFYTNDPLRISVGTKMVMADRMVQQHFAQFDGYRDCENALIFALEYIIKQDEKAKILVFCNSKRNCDELNMKYMDQVGNSDFIRHSIWHGDIPQKQREETLYGLKSGSKNVVFCTDVASRGIDISGITVIQYQFPNDRERSDARERYIHRLGRAGRADRAGNCYTIDSRAPEWGEMLLEILEDVDQVGPAQLYERCGGDPGDRELPPDFPEWAGGPPKADAGWYYELEEDEEPGEDDSPPCRTWDIPGEGNRFNECLKFFNPEYNGSGIISENDFHAKATEAGLTLSIYQGEWEEYGTFGEGPDEKWLAFCPKDSTSANIDHFRPLLEVKEWQNALRRSRGQKVRGATKNRAVVSNAVNGDVHAPNSWAGQRVNVYWASENASYPALCTEDDGEFATVKFDDESFGTETVERSLLSKLGDKVLETVEQSKWIGVKVQAKYSDGEWYAATIKDDYENGTYVVTWDMDGSEDDVNENDIQWPAEPVAAPEPAVGDAKCEVEFGGEWFPATLLADNGDQTYNIKYDNAEYGEETVEEARIKFPSAAPAAGNFSVGPVMAWFGGDDGSYEPANIVSIGDDGYHVLYVGYEEDGETVLTEESLQAMENSAAAQPESSTVAAGTKVEVQYEEVWYPATVKADLGGGQYNIAYEDTSFGEEEVGKDRIKFPEASSNSAPAEAPAAKFSVGPIQAWYGGEEDGSFVPAKITSIGADGYHVLYIGFEEDGEEVLDEYHLKAAEGGDAAAAEPESAQPERAHANGPANIYYEAEDRWMPGVVHDFQDGQYKITYDGFEEEYWFTPDCIQALSAEPDSAPMADSALVVEDSNEEEIQAGEEPLAPAEIPAEPLEVDASAQCPFEVGQSGLEGLYKEDGSYYAIEITAINGDKISVKYTEYDEDAELDASEIRGIGEEKSESSKPALYAVGEEGLQGTYEGEEGYFDIAIQSINDDGTYNVNYVEYGEDAVLAQDQIRRKPADEIAEPSEQPAMAFSVGEDGLEGQFGDEGFFAIAVVGITEDGNYTVKYTDFPEDGEHVLLEAQIQRASVEVEQFEPEQADVEGQWVEEGEISWFPVSIERKGEEENTYYVKYTDFPDEEEALLKGWELRRKV